MPQTALENIDATETVIDAPQQTKEKPEDLHYLCLNPMLFELFDCYFVSL